MNTPTFPDVVSSVMQAVLTQDTISVIPDRRFVQIAWLAPIKFKSSVAWRMHSATYPVPN